MRNEGEMGLWEMRKGAMRNEWEMELWEMKERCSCDKWRRDRAMRNEGEMELWEMNAQWRYEKWKRGGIICGLKNSNGWHAPRRGGRDRPMWRWTLHDKTINGPFSCLYNVLGI